MAKKVKSARERQRQMKQAFIAEIGKLKHDLDLAESRLKRQEAEAIRWECRAQTSAAHFETLCRNIKPEFKCGDES